MAMKKNGVSAVVSCMTASEFPFLRETLDALVDQVDQVILCIDERFENFEEQHGLDRYKNVKFDLLRMPLRPLGEVRNRGIQLVEHEWTALCDGDDVWCDGKIRRQLELLEATGSQFCGCDHILIDQDGLGRVRALSRFIPMPSSWIAKTELFKDYPFDAVRRMTEDGEWWIRTNNACKKVRLAEPYLLYRVRGGSLSSQFASKKRKTLLVRIAKIPVLGIVLKSCAWVAWRMTRADSYVWHPNWSKPL